MSRRSLKHVFFKGEWVVGIRKINGKPLYEINGQDTRPNFITMPRSLRYWSADPFIINIKDKIYIFFELWDNIKRKGELAYRVYVNGRFSKIHKIYESEYHISYPFVSMDGTKVRIVPECYQFNELSSLLFDPQKGICEKEKVLVPRLSCVDSTFFKFKGRSYFFTTPDINGDRRSSLYLYEFSSDSWVKKAECIVNDNSRARMAGAVIEKDDCLIRVSQNCKEMYGGSIVFSRIGDLTDDVYKENRICEISTNDVSFDRVSDIKGIHTYNCNGEYEVIDGYRYQFLNIYHIIGYLRKHLLKLLSLR